MLRTESHGHNSLRSDKCPQLSNAFSCRLRGSQLPGSGGPDPEPRRRWELAEGTPALRWRWICNTHCSAGGRIVYKRKRLKSFDLSLRAEEGTWTLMILLSHGPEPCASANSATSAFLIYQSLSRDCSFIITDVWIKVNSFFEIFLFFFTVSSKRTICYVEV